MEQGSGGEKVDSGGSDSKAPEQVVSVAATNHATSARQELRKTRLIGQVFDLLKVVAFSRFDRGRAVWTCECECGAIVERASQTFSKNKERGRKTGCEACVPSRRITERGPRMTDEERRLSRLASQSRYNEKRAGERRGRAQRRNRYGEPAIERLPDSERLFIWQGKAVGEARTELDKAWFRRVFGD